MIEHKWLKTNVYNIIMDGISFSEEKQNGTGTPPGGGGGGGNAGGGGGGGTSNKKSGGGRPPGVTGDNAKLPNEELVTIVTKNGKKYKLTKNAAQAYFTLKQAASNAGYDLDSELTSAYRDWNEQDTLYKNRSKYPVAKPGYSNHGWGQAIDVNSYSKVHKWLKKNAIKYNWYWYGPKDRVHFTYGYSESGHPGYE